MECINNEINEIILQEFMSWGVSEKESKKLLKIVQMLNAKEKYEYDDYMVIEKSGVKYYFRLDL